MDSLPFTNTVPIELFDGGTRDSTSCLHTEAGFSTFIYKLTFTQTLVWVNILSNIFYDDTHGPVWAFPYHSTPRKLERERLKAAGGNLRLHVGRLSKRYVRLDALHNP